MDAGATVTGTAALHLTVPVEQAVFTSVRSPLGQGYRLVAASAGISPDEKREIVQRAPSHGSLCDSESAAVGLASFTLRTGRQCLFLSRIAGIEPTARGGYRVCTHVLVMEQADFFRYGCNPLVIETLARPLFEAAWAAAPPAALGTLALPAPVVSAERAGTVGVAPADMDRCARVAGAVLDGKRLLVVGAPRPRDVLTLVFSAIPAALRPELSLSYGLRYAPARCFRLMLAQPDRADIERVARDQALRVLRWDAAPAEEHRTAAPREQQQRAAPREPGGRSDAPCAAWLGFARRRWESGRWSELDRLAAELTGERSAHDLARIAALAEDLERVGSADEALLDRLLAVHAADRPRSLGHARLLGELRQAATARRATLERQRQEQEAPPLPTPGNPPALTS